MDGIDWRTVSGGQFWQLADELQDRTIDHARQLFVFAESAQPDELRSLLIQYRFFTSYYIPDIAILIARLRDGRLRSFLAHVLSDELGCGDPLKAHPRLYDDFLESIGTATDGLDTLALSRNVEVLDQVRSKLLDPEVSPAYGVGLRGMGGECVCQIYLSRFYQHIMKNRYIQDRKAQIDWRFWDLHVGEHDIEHRRLTRELINEEIVVRDSGMLADLGKGYYESMASWSAFWDNIFDAVKRTKVERTHARATANFAMCGARTERHSWRGEL